MDVNRVVLTQVVKKASTDLKKLKNEANVHYLRIGVKDRFGNVTWDILPYAL